MTSALIGLRYFAFGLFIVCNTILCSVGVWNLSLVQRKSSYNSQISAYVIFLGAFSLLWIFPIIFIDLIRRNAITSRIWVEHLWVAIFWVMEFCGAVTLSAVVPSNHCRPSPKSIAANICLSGKVLLGFAWAITLILLGYLAALAAYTILHHVADPNVWNETVREYPWFASRSTLSSSLPSPTVDKEPGVPSLSHPRPRVAFDPSGLNREPSPFDDPVQPAPTFDRILQLSHQPPQRTYEGLHLAAMQDPPPIIDPTFTRPREAPKPPVRVQSLYPEHMQAQLSTEARNNLDIQLRQLEGQEPSPIGDWPRKTRNGGTTNSRRQPPPPLSRINTDASTSRQQPLSSDQRFRPSGTTSVPSPVYTLGSPIRGPQIRRQPPPPLNLDGISNTSHRARR